MRPGTVRRTLGPTGTPLRRRVLMRELAKPRNLGTDRGGEVIRCDSFQGVAGGYTVLAGMIRPCAA